MVERVALAGVHIGRPPALPGVEVTAGGPEPRHFPPHLSETLGLCVKYGPSHPVTVDGRVRDFPADALCVRAPGCVWECDTARAGFLSIDIPAAFVPDVSLGGGMRFASAAALPDLSLQAQLLLAADSALAAEELVAGLVARVHRLGGVDLAVEAGRPAAVTRAREFIHAGFRSPLTLERIAEAAGLNKFSLVRRFRDAHGTTPYAYVVMLRVSRARELLAAGARPAQAALDVGFSDQAHMSRWFARVSGVTPADYARRVAAPSRRSISFKTLAA